MGVLNFWAPRSQGVKMQEGDGEFWQLDCIGVSILNPVAGPVLIPLHLWRGFPGVFLAS